MRHDLGLDVLVIGSPDNAREAAAAFVHEGAGDAGDAALTPGRSTSTSMAGGSSLAMDFSVMCGDQPANFFALAVLLALVDEAAQRAGLRSFSS